MESAPPSLKEWTIEQWAEEAIASSPTLSLSIGTLRDNQTETQHFGKTHPPNDDSFYEIGSLTKVFTAILLAKFSQQNIVSLDDPVKLHLSDLPHFPTDITLRRLSTHTSGLPRLPRNLWWSILKNPANPYLNYSTQDLYKFLQRYRESKRNLKRIDQFEYSNLGVSLLGLVLETVTQTPYEQLVKQHICQPLGLTQTTIQLSPDQQQNLIPGYPPNSKANAKSTPAWDLPAFAGAGALRSTLPDLLKFAAANLQANSEEMNSDPATEPLAAAMAQCQQPQQPIEPKSPVDRDLAGETRIGLGWFIRPLKETPLQIYCHDGGTGGHQSYFACSPSEQLAVVILANCAPSLGDKGFSANTLGDRILRQMYQQQLSQSVEP